VRTASWATRALFFVLTAGLGACRGGSGGAERPIEVVVPSDAETLDPRFTTDALGVRVARLVHAQLVGIDPTTLAPVPLLAERWAWEDGTTLRLQLHAGLTFHSGAPLTSRDVVASLRAYGDPKVGSRHARQVAAIGSIEEDGPLAVRIRLARAHATLLTDLDLPILRADEATSGPASGFDGARILDGLGAFQIARAKRGVIELAPAPPGHAGVPGARHAVTIRTVRDENARALRLEAGRADVAPNALSPTLLPALTGAFDLDVRARPAASLTYLVVRTDRGPFADRSLRLALSLAIDRELLATTILGGYAEPADTLFPATHWAYVTPATRLHHDPTTARNIIAEKTGGGRIHAQLLTSTDRLRGTLARAIAQEVADVGIDLEVVPLELGTMLARLAAGDFDLGGLQIPELIEPNTMRVFLHSANIPPAGSNRGRVRDGALDQLLDLGASIQETATRRAIYGEVDRLVRMELPIIPLWHEDQVVVTSARARAFIPGADGRWGALADL
jgi:peptide/nickel transport system substrate-binding protein